MDESAGPSKNLPETEYQSMLARRNAKDGAGPKLKPRIIRNLGYRLQGQRHHRIDAKFERPIEVYRAIMEVLTHGQVGIDDAKKAIDLVLNELDDLVSETLMSWQEEGTTNWLGSDWGR